MLLTPQLRLASDIGDCMLAKGGVGRVVQGVVQVVAAIDGLMSAWSVFQGSTLPMLCKAWDW